MVLRFRSAAGETREATVDPKDGGCQVTVGGRVFEIVVRRADGASLDLLVDGRPVSAVVAGEGDTRFVKIEDDDPVVLQRLGRERASSPPAPESSDGALTALMEGQVVAVAARPGERVESGVTLVVLEAMKMEMKVTAPFAGRVVRVACAVGEVVRRGQVLIEMTPEPI